MFQSNTSLKGIENSGIWNWKCIEAWQYFYIILGRVISAFSPTPEVVLPTAGTRSCHSVCPAFAWRANWLSLLPTMQWCFLLVVTCLHVKQLITEWMFPSCLMHVSLKTPGVDFNVQWSLFQSDLSAPDFQTEHELPGHCSSMKAERLSNRNVTSAHRRKTVGLFDHVSHKGSVNSAKKDTDTMFRGISNSCFYLYMMCLLIVSQLFSKCNKQHFLWLPVWKRMEENYFHRTYSATFHRVVEVSVPAEKTWEMICLNSSNGKAKYVLLLTAQRKPEQRSQDLYSTLQYL